MSTDKSLDSLQKDIEEDEESENEQSNMSTDKSLDSLQKDIEEDAESENEQSNMSTNKSLESLQKDIEEIEESENEQENIQDEESENEQENIQDEESENAQKNIQDEESENAQKNIEDEESENETEQKDIENNDNITETSVNYIKNIDGMTLNNPYFFQDRIKKREPSLIITQKQGNYNAYSRICPSTTRRQPVILNENEKKTIEQNYGNDFLKEEDIIKYGSNPDKQYYYICPRYWCLKTNSYISEEDVKLGKCGKILPKNAKKVIPGHYVYEFYTPPKDKPNYKHYPGFQDNSHPQGFCLPCCFKTWNTKEQIHRRNKCSGKEPPPKKSENVQQETKQQDDNYIKGPEKFPLSSGRWGYLQVAIQKILHEINSECYKNKHNTNIKSNYACLLRHGVELNENQSFIACIADAVFYARKDENGIPFKIPTIKYMKDIIIMSLTIDNFIKYQNGNLVTNFHKLNENIDISKYANSTIYSKLNKDNKIEMIYFKNVISAFENFINFLKDDEIIIDHSYLWDIICSPNKHIFPNGINLIILQLSNNDITNNVELICPTNQYSNNLYESRKPNLILIREGNYFEPVYSYNNNEKRILIGKTFSEYDPNLSKTLMAVLKKIIKPYIQNKCIPVSSMPTQYIAKRPILLQNLIQLLNKKRYEIIKQVVNYNSKVIGVIAENKINKNLRGFVPCYPSAINDTYKYVYMIDDDLWNTYENTIEFLTKISGKIDIIPCKPAFKVIEDEHIVGILTETNQFIQLSEPKLLLDVNDNIPTLENNNYIIKIDNKVEFSDNIITSITEKDKERTDYIKRIKLETNFYNVFRNTIRILINDYENLNIREKIEDELNKSYLIYSEKLKIIEILLRSLVKNKIEFTGDSNFYKQIEEVTTCIIKNTKKCELHPKICMVTENDECVLILPKKNLITNNNNEKNYYIKLTDELIRYNRINSFIFKPQTYLSFGNVNYNLNDDEIIMVQSLLTQEYFDSMIPTSINKYVKYNTYDQTEPLKTQIYDNVIEINEAINQDNVKECNTVTNSKIKSVLWRKCFPKDYSEIEYQKTNYCTFYFVSEIIKKIKDEVLTINDIKKILIQEYLKYYKEHHNKIIDILILEGKKTLGDQVKAQTLSFEHFIWSDSYFITNLDLWIIIEKYKIPCFFISSKYLLETTYNRKSFMCYGNESSDEFLFIVVPGLRSENVPMYKYIQDANKNINISMNVVNESSCKNDIHKSIKNHVTVEKYLKTFTKNTTTTYKQKLPVEIIEVNERVKPKLIETKKKFVIMPTNKHDLEVEKIVNDKLLDKEITSIKKTKKQKSNDYFDKKLKTRKTRKNIKKIFKIISQPNKDLEIQQNVNDKLMNNT